MNPKIDKLRGDLSKYRQKISDLQAKCRDLERQIRELEDTDIVGLVRESGMTIEEFIAMFQNPTGKAAPLPKETEVPHGED